MRIPHELPEEFPDDARFIEQLSKSNYEFRRLTADYNEVNQQLYRSSRKMNQPSMRCSDR